VNLKKVEKKRFPFNGLLPGNLKTKGEAPMNMKIAITEVIGFIIKIQDQPNNHFE